MIQGTNRNTDEKSYRAVLLDSSSSLKDFSMDRKKYFKKYLLNETLPEDEEDDNKSVTTGRIVETILLEPELFDDKFALSSIVKLPTGKMLDFVNALVTLTLESLDERGICTTSFEERCEKARVMAEYDWSLKVILSKFIGQDPEIYFEELKNIRANNLVAVTMQDVTNAEKIVEELKNNFVTKDIINLVTSSRYTIFNQMQVEGYEIDGHLFKSMMDKLVIDHKNKTLSVFDLKCTWSVEQFYEKYYLYRRSYIQGYLYYKAAIFLTQNENSEYYGYTVLPPSFIVCDSTNYFNPLIYEMSQEDLNDAYNGFEYKGRKYVGVKELIEELQWSLDMNIWNMSKKNFESKGVVTIKEMKNGR